MVSHTLALDLGQWIQIGDDLQISVYAIDDGQVWFRIEGVGNVTIPLAEKSEPPADEGRRLEGVH